MALETLPGSGSSPAIPHSNPEVLIAGAGPTGLMVAALLLRCGVRPRILDKSPGPAKESRAFAVQARSLELFQSIGLADRFLDAGLIATGAQIVIDGTPVAALDFDDIGRADTPYPFALMVPQWKTEAILAEDLRGLGVEIEYGTEVLDLAQTSDGVKVTVQANGAVQEIRASYVIGADGAHSSVRKALGLRFDGAAYPQSFFLADCRINWPLGYDRLTLFLHGRHFAAYLPLKGKEIGRVIVIDQSEAEHTEGLEKQGTSAISLQIVEDAFRDATKLDVTLSDPVWTSRYHVHHRGVDRYGVGRVFVAGDAAHIHSPAGGQGMNTGLQDAANLVWKLALVLNGGAPAALLNTYHDERWPVGKKVLERTDNLFSRATSQNALFVGLRDAILPLVAGPLIRNRTVRAKAFHFVSQLGIRYHESAFVHDDPSHGASRDWRDGLTAGHRAPDGTISNTLRVFDLLQGYRFTLLALSRRALAESDVAEIVADLDAVRNSVGFELRSHLIARSLIGRDPRLIQAESGDVFAAYGLGPEASEALVLVRPDGYIAYRSDRLDTRGLQVYLGHFAGK